MSEFPRNSESVEEPKKERQKQEKIISGEATIRKKGWLKKTSEAVIEEDGKSVISNLFETVLIPQVKNTIVDFVSDGIAMLVNGETRRQSPRGKASPFSHVSYDRAFSEPRTSRPYALRASHSFDDICLTSRAEAQEVIFRLCDLIDEYGSATVSDLYDLVGITAAHTDERWGWKSLGTASSVRSGEGYLLNLPRPVAL